jgi:FkbM family methyltransferase
LFSLNDEGHHYVEALGDRGVLFSQELDDLFVTYEGVKVKITTNQELFIFHEVFIKKVYNLIFPHACTIVDIGMNVGFASLFFALLPNVDRVIGFEPFPTTFFLAQENLRLNPHLSRKIKPHCKGLGIDTYSAEVWYDEIRRGSNKIDSNSVLPIKETVLIEKASEALSFHVGAPPGLVVKIDAEGSEDIILYNLEASGYISNVDYFMIEYHEDNSKELIKVLTYNGFKVLHLDYDPKYKVGMLYAS